MPLKKNHNGRYEFDLIGFVKLLALIGAALLIYFTKIGSLETSMAVQNERINALSADVGKIEEISRKVDSIIIILNERLTDKDKR
jgi:hypothetical protein